METTQSIVAEYHTLNNIFLKETGIEQDCPNSLCVDFIQNKMNTS